MAHKSYAAEVTLVLLSTRYCLSELLYLEAIYIFCPAATFFFTGRVILIIHRTLDYNGCLPIPTMCDAISFVLASFRVVFSFINISGLQIPTQSDSVYLLPLTLRWFN